jgi:hypothetical protein
MTTPGDRLTQARKKAGYASAAAAARAFGWNVVTYRAHESGMRDISRDAAQRYRRAYKITLDWLLEGKGTTPDSGLIEPVTMTLPVLGEAQAGAWKEVAAVEEADAERMPVPAEHRIPGARQYWIRVVGDSVDRFMREGSLALCTDVWDWARDSEDLFRRGKDKLVLCQRERHGLYETTIKQLKITGTKAELWPASHNPKHDGPIPLGDTSDVNGVSVVAIVTHALIQF